MTLTTRASLLLRLRDSRDHESWLEFVTLYEPVVYRLLRRHGLQDADAHEVMQELFLAVSRSVERWDPDRERGSFRAWMVQFLATDTGNLLYTQKPPVPFSGKSMGMAGGCSPVTSVHGGRQQCSRQRLVHND